MNLRKPPYMIGAAVLLLVGIRLLAPSLTPPSQHAKNQAAARGANAPRVGAAVEEEPHLQAVSLPGGLLVPGRLRGRSSPYTSPGFGVEEMRWLEDAFLKMIRSPLDVAQAALDHASVHNVVNETVEQYLRGNLTDLDLLPAVGDTASVGIAKAMLREMPMRVLHDSIFLRLVGSREQLHHRLVAIGDGDPRGTFVQAGRMTFSLEQVQTGNYSTQGEDIPPRIREDGFAVFVFASPMRFRTTQGWSSWRQEERPIAVFHAMCLRPRSVREAIVLGTNVAPRATGWGGPRPASFQIWDIGPQPDTDMFPLLTVLRAMPANQRAYGLLKLVQERQDPEAAFLLSALGNASSPGIPDAVIEHWKAWALEMNYGPAHFREGLLHWIEVLLDPEDASGARGLHSLAAFAQFNLGMKAGHLPSLTMVARMLMDDSPGVAQDKERAYAYLTYAAEHADPDALCEVAKLRRMGVAIAESIRGNPDVVLHGAANLGSVEALLRLTTPNRSLPLDPRRRYSFTDDAVHRANLALERCNYDGRTWWIRVVNVVFDRFRAQGMLQRQ